jgi:Glycosyl hydrolase family 79 C-terminal beta domain
MGPSDAEFPALPLSSNGITITTTYLTPANMVSFVQQEGSSLKVVSQHSYATFGSNVGGNPQPGILLEPASTTANPAVAAQYAAIAKQAGKPYRLAEMNSIAGSGQTVPGYKRGLVKRLLAPSFSAINGITIGGQTFDGSQDGKPVGTAYGEFTRSQNGTFEVSVGPTSAFLLTLHKRDRDCDGDDD